MDGYIIHPHATTDAKNISLLVYTVMDSYIIHPHATTDAKNIFEQATKLAASVPAPATRSVHKRTWYKHILWKLVQIPWRYLLMI